ncbi:hypothetical protein LTR37_001354 [Vermiconidia calcicola]|uniref:Uncharacterized protein n=1 Tax=Vermiconidia calcicola TaxID=1690605 RepID=A0ACC3NVT6_9PEZI|nr:hypothetical protein LTR37_001354 [Vermiconidia calcicola]
MKMRQSTTSLLLTALLASSASAQLLAQGNGQLPQCGQSCPVISSAVQQCNGASNADLNTWACFCESVWTNSNQNIAAVCAASCTNPTDNTAISTWYTNNCGSDNGASLHGGSSAGSGTSGTTGATGSESSSAANEGAPTSDADESSGGSWWSGHWKWVLMVIILAVGLTILGFGGRWLKKRHDRKQDRINGGFNEGITTRGPPMSSANNVHDSAVTVGGDVDPSNGRNSPSRTREAFMPYGYGYTRSESRLASGGIDRGGSPLARGGTPLHEVEKGPAETPESLPKKKSRRVMVRERSQEDSVA